ncbi:hypothetical protein ACFDTO_16120 [Microbacteriaceae bacterium 4G12]
MEGSYFYFFAWVSWTIATFLMKKGKMRLLIASLSLLLVISSQTAISIGPFHVYISSFLLMGIGFIGIASYSKWKKVHAIISSMIVAMMYTIFHLIELYDPIWIVVNRVWMLSGLLIYVTLLLIREPWLRLYVLSIGGVQGEIFLAAVLRKYEFHNAIGPGAFLDVIACTVVLLCIVHLLFKGFMYIEPLKRKHVKERQG